MRKSDLLRSLRLAELVDMDILRPSNAQRRNRAFRAHQVLNALHTGLEKYLSTKASLQQEVWTPPCRTGLNRTKLIHLS